MLHNLLSPVKQFVVTCDNDMVQCGVQIAGMSAAKSMPQKQVSRPHFIPDWAERRGMKQVDIANETGADKSVVSRWFAGATPSEHWQIVLAGLFSIERDALFRHPDEDWLARFMRGRSDDEVKRIKDMLEAGFPRDKREAS